MQHVLNCVYLLTYSLTYLLGYLLTFLVTHLVTYLSVDIFQGYNRAIIFSRPSYFCLCGCLVLALHYASLSWRGTAFRLYGAPFTVPDFIICARDLVIGWLLIHV